MVKTRVHDLAAEFGIPAEQLMNMLRDMHIFVRSHMSPLEDAQVSAIRVRWEREKRKLAQATEAPAPKKRAKKAAKPAEPEAVVEAGKPVKRRRTAAEVAQAEEKAEAERAAEVLRQEALELARPVEKREEPMLPAALTTDGIPSAIRSILMLPPLMFLAADGGTMLFDVLQTGRLGPSSRRIGFKPEFLRAAAGVFCLALAIHTYRTYFVLYANRPEPQQAFNADYVAIARTIDRLPIDTRKIVVEGAQGVAVRGHRMPTQTVMFITDTFDPDMAAKKNVVYVDPEDLEHTDPGVTFYLR